MKSLRRQLRSDLSVNLVRGPSRLWYAEVVDAGGETIYSTAGYPERFDAFVAAHNWSIDKEKGDIENG